MRTPLGNAVSLHEWHSGFGVNGNARFSQSPSDLSRGETNWHASDNARMIYSAGPVNGNAGKQEHMLCHAVPTNCQSSIQHAKTVVPLPSMVDVLDDMRLHSSFNGIHSSLLPLTAVKSLSSIVACTQSLTLSRMQDCLSTDVPIVASEIVQCCVSDGKKISGVSDGNDNYVSSTSDGERPLPCNLVTHAVCNTSSVADVSYTNPRTRGVSCEDMITFNISSNNVDEPIKNYISPYESVIQLADRWLQLNTPGLDMLKTTDDMSNSLSECDEMMVYQLVPLADSDLEWQLTLSEQYWRCTGPSSTADGGTILSGAHLCIINRSLRAYDRFVRASAKINESLDHELRVGYTRFCVVLN